VPSPRMEDAEGVDKENRGPGEACTSCGLCGWKGEGKSLNARVAHAKRCAAKAASGAASKASSAFLARAFPLGARLGGVGETIARCGGTGSAFGRLLAGAVDSGGVRDLLAASGLAEAEARAVASAMARERVGLLEARALTESDWIDLGATRLGPRRKLMAACAAMAVRSDASATAAAEVGSAGASESGEDSEAERAEEDREVAGRVELAVRSSGRGGAGTSSGCARCGISLVGRSKVQRERHETTCGRKTGEQSCPHCGVDVSGKTLKWTIAHTGRCAQAVAGARGNIERRRQLIHGAKAAAAAAAAQPTIAEVLRLGPQPIAQTPPVAAVVLAKHQTTLRFADPAAEERGADAGEDGAEQGDGPAVSVPFGQLVAAAAAANDVEAFLQALGQTHLVDVFRKHKVDLAALRHLTDADLRWKLEIKELGPRRAILAALGRKPDTSTTFRAGKRGLLEDGIEGRAGGGADDGREVIVVEDNAEEDMADEARRAAMATADTERRGESPDALGDIGALSDHVIETSGSDGSDGEFAPEPASKRRASLSRMLNSSVGLWAPGGLYDLARTAPAQFEGFDDRDSFIQRRLDHTPTRGGPEGLGVGTVDAEGEEPEEQEEPAAPPTSQGGCDVVHLVSDSSQSRGTPRVQPRLSPPLVDDGAGPAPTPSPGGGPSGCSPGSQGIGTLVLEDLIGRPHEVTPVHDPDPTPMPTPSQRMGNIQGEGVNDDVWVLSDSMESDGELAAKQASCRETPLSALQRRQRRRSSASDAGLSPGERIARLRQHYSALVAAQEAIRAEAELEIERLREDEARAVARVSSAGTPQRGEAARTSLTSGSGSLGDQLPEGPDMGFVPASQAAPQVPGDKDAPWRSVHGTIFDGGDVVQGSSSESESDADDPGYVVSSQMVGAVPAPAPSQLPSKVARAPKAAAASRPSKRLVGFALDRAVCAAIRGDTELWERCLVLDAVRAEDVVRVAAGAGVRVGKAAAARILVDQGVAVQP